jgi:hypothetical protein
MLDSGFVSALQVFFPYTMSAVLLADLGMDPYRIDAAVAGKFGMPMGPFRYGAICVRQKRPRAKSARQQRCTLHP